MIKKRTTLFDLKPSGFTLLEILLSMAIILIVSTGSFIMFSQFGKKQNFNNAYQDLLNTFNEAKSAASSQVVVNCTSAQTLVGYQIRFIPYPNPTSYTIEEVCLKSDATQIATRTKTTVLPSGVTLQAGTQSALFQVITGNVINSGGNLSFTLTGGGQSKTIVVDQSGVVQ